MIKKSIHELVQTDGDIVSRLPGGVLLAKAVPLDLVLDLALHVQPIQKVAKLKLGRKLTVIGWSGCEKQRTSRLRSSRMRSTLYSRMPAISDSTDATTSRKGGRNAVWKERFRSRCKGNRPDSDVRRVPTAHLEFRFISWCAQVLTAKLANEKASFYFRNLNITFRNEQSSTYLEWHLKFQTPKNKQIKILVLNLQAPSKKEEKEVEVDEVDVLVIDNGTGFIKAGFSGEDAPRLVIPTFVCESQQAAAALGANKGDGHTHIWLGTDALQAYRQGVGQDETITLSTPIERGEIKDFEAMKKIWEFVFQELEIDPTRTTVSSHA